MRRVIWTVYRVYPERGRVRVLDTPDDALAAAEFRRHVGLASIAAFGLVELRRDGELRERWAATDTVRAVVERSPEVVDA